MPIIVQARERTVGGVPVLRPLPTRVRRSVGPFVFLDELGPLLLPAGRGLDVRPHPHIGLSTLTYRLSGEMVHRDSLGSTQTIRPGAVNWMTAGRGVTHSERSAASEREPECEVHGVQLWVALEPESEEVEPSFEHHPRERLPELDLGAVRARLVAGEAFGAASPVRVHSPLFCVDALWQAHGELELDPALGERAAYPLVGEFECDGETVGRGQLALFEDGRPARLRAERGARVLLLGGRRREAPLHMHWNYVASDPARIADAKRRWASGGFPPVVGDEDTPEPDPSAA